MDARRSPFLNHRWSQQQQQSPAAGGGSFKRQPSTRVISIPVHFVQSERTQSESAVKIQKAVRGFLVRRSLKRILAVKREVDEIERQISEREKAELIRNDSKERLRVSETLMALLLKLDSVRGIHSGVRDCRKGVIKKAIALQERVDQISLTPIPPPPENSDEENQARDSQLNVIESEEVEPDEQIADVEMVKEDGEDEPKTIYCLSDCAATEAVIEAPPTELLADFPCNGAMEEQKVEEEEGVMKDVEPDEKKRSRDLLEKMVEDNERLMGMVTELSERNELHTRMLSSLTQRVELLEKAFVSDMMARKKKKKTGKKQ